MPESSMNVYFTITDNGSPVLARISDKTKALDKETQQLNQTFAAMQKVNGPLIESQKRMKERLGMAA